MSKKFGLWLCLALPALALLGGCSSTASSPTAGASSRFPVTVHAANGAVTVRSKPTAIVSLSPTATEMLYAVGAGSQVKAVEKDSDYPPRAPRTSLDGNTIDVEAVASHHPDLVIASQDTPAVDRQLEDLGIPVLSMPAAVNLSQAYGQFVQIGEATGHLSAANAEVAHIKAALAHIVATVGQSAHGASYYYELDQTYYSVDSSTFIGRLLGLLGLRNIADKAQGVAQSGGYPQLNAEFILASQPDYILLADTLCCGQSPQTVAARPGWSVLSAVRGGRVLGLNDDIASRWGPRIVTLLQDVADEIARHPVKVTR